MKMSSLRQQRVAFALGLCLAVVAGGCGSGSTVSPDEAGAISLILDVSDATRNEAEFAAIFATGQTPEKKLRRKYAEYSFSPIGKPTVTESDATIMVEVSDAKDDPIGQVTWTAVKEQGKWKLATAPLP